MNRTVRRVLMNRLIVHISQSLRPRRNTRYQAARTPKHISSGGADCVSYISLTRKKERLSPPDSPALSGKRESWAKFELSSPVEAYSPEAREFKPLLIVECRGLEFIGFDPQVFLRLHCRPSL